MSSEEEAVCSATTLRAAHRTRDPRGRCCACGAPRHRGKARGRDSIPHRLQGDAAANLPSWLRRCEAARLLVGLAGLVKIA